MAMHPALIVGGTGKTGARVDARLCRRGIATRPVSRSSAVAFDWARPDTWRAARDFADYARAAAATGVWSA
ncbi:hypothetical protein WT67_23165 [Burkholderia stagnalis]|uniref:hypothetical protein n=1 Tax=Burkholderia stagnalis TaxID=1503054 RepID=UPI00075E7B23|nr:hypothetical protein [Burkholderia stagnalis]KVO52971.1 hypothetical protein WT17_29620 [Burkholderia stagnalis]KVO69794.1 hypothetical protein WT19_20190 [Burkholderia stagnalis]KVW64482.1 hypothetical protein WT28_11725 [Burkholderia stagnalis]KVW81168.1 hypothetical protein WT29_12505 [Burkholderia stagnalis]KVX81102.1 hypothetical protein WT34_04980 [Burkholderia stagnalis]